MKSWIASLFLFSCFGSLSLQAEPSQYEQDLFLTPGGKYTEEDIMANGNTTRSEKFKSYIPHFHADAEPGDVMCPVSLKKANSECSWIIGGNSYKFCCPYCIDEFLQLAKEHPEKIQDPEVYVK